MSKSARAIVAFGAVAVMLIGGFSFTAGSVSASIDPMGPRMLQQMVLRVQFPGTFGPWRQNMYGTSPDSALTVCYGTKGPISATKAKVIGFITYFAEPDISGGVSVAQYASKAKATKALTALRRAKCTAAPLVPTEAEKMVTGAQEFTRVNSENKGLSSSMTYVEPGEGVRGYFSTLSTQRGLAVVQTTVRSYAQTPQSTQQRKDALSQVGSVNSTWHRRVLTAYKNFGIIGTTR